MGTSQSPDVMMRLFAKFEPKGGSFRCEHPQHRVIITLPFLLGKSAVTIGAFCDFVTATGYVTEPETDGKGGWGYDSYDPKATGDTLVGPEPRFTWRHTGWEQSELHPVVNVTWNDSMAFAEHLNQQTKRSISKGQLWRLARKQCKSQIRPFWSRHTISTSGV